VTLDLGEFIQARDESLLNLPLLGRNVPIDGYNLLRIDSLGWVKAEPSLSLAAPHERFCAAAAPSSPREVASARP